MKTLKNILDNHVSRSKSSSRSGSKPCKLSNLSKSLIVLFRSTNYCYFCLLFLLCFIFTRNFFWRKCSTRSWGSSCYQLPVNRHEESSPLVRRALVELLSHRCRFLERDGAQLQKKGTAKKKYRRGESSLNSPLAKLLFCEDMCHSTLKTHVLLQLKKWWSDLISMKNFQSKH